MNFRLSINQDGDVVVSSPSGSAVISKYDVVQSKGSNSTIGVLDVIAIKRMYRSGIARRVIADKYGVSTRTIFRIASDDSHGCIQTEQPE